MQKQLSTSTSNLVHSAGGQHQQQERHNTPSWDKYGENQDGECESEDGECESEDGECESEDGECQSEDGEYQSGDGECEIED